MLSGKGMYLWQVAKTEGGNVDAIVKMAVAMCFSHVLVKIADGAYPYNAALLPQLVDGLKSAGIQVWGWQYVYGNNPTGEAMIASSIIQGMELDGFVVNAEVEYKRAGSAFKAKTYMQTLRAGVGLNLPIALSTYRWPTYHPEFPFDAFLEYCDIAMPQVYWLQAHNPTFQLQRTIKEYAALKVQRQVFPTGACFLQSGWKPTASEVAAFIQAAKDAGLQGVNFWEWANARTYVADGWEVIRSIPWTNTPEPQPEPEPEPLPEPVSGMRMKVLVDGLNVRSAPSLSAPITGRLVLGDIVRIANIAGQDVWVKFPDGTFAAAYVGGRRYMEVIE